MFEQHFIFMMRCFHTFISILWYPITLVLLDNYGYWNNQLNSWMTIKSIITLTLILLLIILYILLIKCCKLYNLCIFLESLVAYLELTSGCMGIYYLTENNASSLAGFSVFLIMMQIGWGILFTISLIIHLRRI